MTDLNTLRQALRATPEPSAFTPDDLDVAVIVRRGRRLRARRRLTVVAGAACVAAAAFGAVSGIGHADGPAVYPAGPGRVVPGRQPGRPVPPPTATPKASPAPESGEPSPTPSRTAFASASVTPSAAYATLPAAGPSASATTPVPMISPSAAGRRENARQRRHLWMRRPAAPSPPDETPGSAATPG